MNEKQPRGHAEPARLPASHLELFQTVSEAGEDTIVQVQALLLDLPALPTEPFEAAMTVRAFLIEKGFEYNELPFQLGDVVGKRQGNCLGLSLLIGALLQERGITAGYDIISNPRDPLYNLGLRYFNELREGDYFPFNDPMLPTLEDVAEHPQYRFAPVEHPVLVFGDTTFETTDLEAEDSDPGWLPESDARRQSSFEGVCSMVYVDRAKSLIMAGDAEAGEVRRLCEEALILDEENADAQYLLWEVAQQTNDREGAEKAREAFLKRDRTDSKYLFEKYQITGDVIHLNTALEKDPTNIPAYYDKHVALETDPAEARFNAAVAAWCTANSTVLNLDVFYAAHEKRIKELFGEEAFKQVHI